MDDLLRKVTLLEILRLALDLTKPHLCAKLELCCGGSLHRRTLGWWEARRHKPDPLGDHALRTFFEVASIALLGLGSTIEAARWWTWMSPEDIVEEMLHRRKMLKDMGLAGIAGAAGLLLPVSPLVAEAQLLGGRVGRRIGGGEVASAQRTATALAIAYAVAPNADVVRAAKAHALTLLDLLKPKRVTMDLSTEARLQAVASDAAALAGYGQYDAGQFDDAHRWFTRALELAREAGDRGLEAYALAAFTLTNRKVGRRLNEPARTGRALAPLQAAAELQAFLPAAGRTWLVAYLAQEHAVLADDLVSGRFLEQARTAAASIRQRDPGWGWWSTHGELAGFDGVRADVFTGARLLRLGHPADAVEVFDASLGGSTEPVRRSDLLWEVMEACVALGDPDRACASGATVLDIADEHAGLTVNVEDVRQTRRSFPRDWAGLTVVRELDERLRAAA